jgi:hypothetical protein
MTEAEMQAMSTEVSDALKLLKDYQGKQGIFHHTDTLRERIESVMSEFENRTANALQAAKEFRDRMVIDLRALSMVVTMAGNASTHREKDARLRGASELLEGAIDRLQREQFDLAVLRGPFFDSVFKSDFPTRHMVERIHELEREVEELNKALNGK